MAGVRKGKEREIEEVRHFHGKKKMQKNKTKMRNGQFLEKNSYIYTDL